MKSKTTRPPTTDNRPPARTFAEQHDLMEVCESLSDLLLEQAKRFEGFARDLALKAVRSESGDEAHKARALCLQHLLRSETFKEAAAIVRKAGGVS